jgi:two-component system sensor histidine kinase AlgZ
VKEVDRSNNLDDTNFEMPDLCNVMAICILILIGELIVFVLLLAGGPITWVRLALISLSVQWIVLGSAGVLCALRPVLNGIAMARGATIVFILVMSVTLLVSVIAQLIYSGEADFANPALDWEQIARQLGIAGIITGVVMRYLYVQQKLREQEQSELQSRIQALQSRIRPHFLFNSMNIIASLISTEPEMAETVVEDLSELFRASLNDAGNQVSLNEEISLCKRYIHIEGLRLGERLEVEWQVENCPPRLKIPLLTLQPLLENAIYHGIQPLPEGGKIRIHVRRESGLLALTVQNPLVEQGRADVRGNRMALANTRSRFAALYGSEASLLAWTEGDSYFTELKYPAVDDTE